MTTIPEAYTSVAICMDAQRKRLDAELQRVRMTEQMHIMRVERDVVDGVRGCFESHQRALEYGLSQAGDGPIFVVEDDVAFSTTCEVNKALRDALKALQNGNVDIVAIGGMATRPFTGIEGNPDVFRTSFQTTHAYAVSRKAARRIILWSFVRNGRFLRIGDHYDHMLSEKLAQAIVYPTVAFQDVRSDVTTTNSTSPIYYTIVKARDMLSQQRLQKMLEWFMYIIGCILSAVMSRS